MTVLRSTSTDWRSDDGYVLTVRHGAYSQRLIGELRTPDGQIHALAMAKRESLADLLKRAEQGVVCHRARADVL